MKTSTVIYDAFRYRHYRREDKEMFENSAIDVVSRAIL
ncbi:hypothetical protein E2C01_044001 [Portunus trituberculatus]|uniref:Uncharacterized protein n=1 Tax=Portunus trituberculatus TaxID=210409 RepID=A0A5B7FZ79_PORTR|nr:hypothetical protein [Portunus trituberculatus]